MKVICTVPDKDPASGDWFYGDVVYEELAAPPPPSRLRVARVQFAAGARTPWHAHPLGQTLIVTEGAGWVKARGGERQEIHPGDRVYFEPDEEHWHGATTDQPMTHLALYEINENGTDTVAGSQITDEEYATDVST